MTEKIKTGTGKISILLADDSEASCRIIRKFLEDENFEVIPAGNGLEALKLAAEKFPDLIILDDIMPVLNGFKTCSRLKENNKTRLIPVLVITSLREQDDRIKAMNSGADDYITRPVEKRELCFRVNRLLEMKRKNYEIVLLERLTSLGRLAGGVAHEINNPLTGVVANIEMLKNMSDRLNEDEFKSICKKNKIKGKAFKNLNTYFAELKKTEEKKKRMLDLAIKGGRRCSKIVGELLSYSSAQRKWSPSKVSVKEVVQKALSLAKSRFKELGVKIDFNSGNDAIETMGNKWELQQVFMSLIANALNAVENRELKKITISVAKERKNVVIRVRDSGCGIPKENLNSIFDYFYTTRDEGEGFGLGLSTVYEIILKHDGSIDVDSEVGRGTEFVVRMPLV